MSVEQDIKDIKRRLTKVEGEVKKLTTVDLKKVQDDVKKALDALKTVTDGLKRVSDAVKTVTDEVKKLGDLTQAGNVLRQAVTYGSPVQLFSTMGIDRNRCVAVAGGDLSHIANYPYGAYPVSADRERATWTIKMPSTRAKSRRKKAKLATLKARSS